MERSLSVNNRTLAQKLTTEISGSLTYVVTDDVQLFSKDTKLGNLSYTPVVLTTITSFENENRFIRTYTYQLMARVRKVDRDLFDSDMQVFRDTQTTETIDSYIVTKVVEKPIKTAEITVQGVDYYDYTIEMRWVYALSKVGTNISITVDSVAIPFLQCDVIHDIGYVSNQSAGSGYRLTNDNVVLTVPLIVGNSKVLALYNAVNSDAYNQTYVLNIDGHSKTVVLKRGNYQFVNTAQIASLVLTFETHYPRVTVELDGDILPVTAYRYNGKKVVESSERVNDVQMGYSTSKVRTWSITFVVSTATAMTKLQADAYGDTLGITYTLDIGLASNFTVELTDVVESYTETGDMKLECQFIEVA